MNHHLKWKIELTQQRRAMTQSAPQPLFCSRGKEFAARQPRFRHEEPKILIENFPKAPNFKLDRMGRNGISYHLFSPHGDTVVVFDASFHSHAPPPSQQIAV